MREEEKRKGGGGERCDTCAHLLHVFLCRFASHAQTASRRYILPSASSASWAALTSRRSNLPQPDPIPTMSVFWPHCGLASMSHNPMCWCPAYSLGLKAGPPSYHSRRQRTCVPRCAWALLAQGALWSRDGIRNLGIEMKPQANKKSKSLLACIYSHFSFTSAVVAK